VEVNTVDGHLFFYLIFKELKEFAAKPSKFFNKSALEKFTEMSYD
jgi:hypothetical protein